MKLYNISYKYKHISKYGQAIVCANSELEACTILHKKFTIGIESCVIVINVIEESNVIILEN
jgi:hypothetical protein